MALLMISIAVGGICLSASAVTRPAPVVIPAFLSTSSALEPTRVRATAVRIWFCPTSYPRKCAIAPTMRVAWT